MYFGHITFDINDSWATCIPLQDILKYLIFANSFQACYMGDNDIEQRCLELIDENGTQSLQSDGFKNLKLETLKMIISRDTLNIKESDVWLASLEWAEKECTRQGKQVNIQNTECIILHFEYSVSRNYIRATMF